MPRPSIPAPRHRWFAAFYDRCMKADDRTIAPVRRLIAGQATGRVLEIGCGTGLNLDFYDWSRITALEATEPDAFMLDRARGRLAALPPDVRSKVKLIEAPAEQLPFDEATFDVVVCTLVLCTVSDLERSLAEVRRVLKPHAQLRLFEHVCGSGVVAAIQRVVQPVYGWTAAGCQLSRHTEATVRASGFTLDISQRLSLGPLWPAFVGIAAKV
jgi:ubiquinone/menaquinone biosynthesis C-methylase UbiE